LWYKKLYDIDHCTNLIFKNYRCTKLIKLRKSKYYVWLSYPIYYDFRIKNYNYKKVYIKMGETIINARLNTNNIWVFDEFKTIENSLIVLDRIKYKQRLLIETYKEIKTETNIIFNVYSEGEEYIFKRMIEDKRFTIKKNNIYYNLNFKNYCYYFLN